MQQMVLELHSIQTLSSDRAEVFIKVLFSQSVTEDRFHLLLSVSNEKYLRGTRSCGSSETSSLFCSYTALQPTPVSDRTGFKCSGETEVLGQNAFIGCVIVYKCINKNLHHSQSWCSRELISTWRPIRMQLHCSAAAPRFFSLSLPEEVDFSVCVLWGLSQSFTAPSDG